VIAKRDPKAAFITKDNRMSEHDPHETILQVKDLGVTYPRGVVALKSTSIDFRRGQFTVLLGLSGAGKSTLLRTLNHLVRPTSGQVVSKQFGSLSSARALQDHRRQTAMVFQQHHLIERHSALANVLTGRLAHHGTWRTLLPLPRREVELALHCLERVGLADKALSRVDQLSGGQQQRVGIARALAQEPSVILADEPVASLDPATSETVLGLLRNICREDGITAVVSLHQLDYAQRFADRIVGLADAQVVFDGPPGGLTDDDYSHIYRAQPSTRQKQILTPNAQQSRRATNLELTR
jgi:phosphonate transport system ATP-binding protein